VQPAGRDGLGEQPAADAAAAKLVDQAEVLELDIVGPVVDLVEAGGHPADIQDEDVDALVVDHGAQLVVGERPTVDPVQRATNGVVEVAIEVDGRRLRLEKAQPDIGRRRHVILGIGRHLEEGDDGFDAVGRLRLPGHGSVPVFKGRS
jgi:hypothetical protein